MDLPGLWSIFTPSPSALAAFCSPSHPFRPCFLRGPSPWLLSPSPPLPASAAQNGNRSLISWGKTPSSPGSYNNQIKSWPDYWLLFFFLFSRAFNSVSLMKFLSELLILTMGTYYHGKIALTRCHVLNLMALHKLILWFKIYLTVCSKLCIEAFKIIPVS